MAQQAANLGRMVAHAKVLLDQVGHPAPGPDIPQKAVGFSALVEQLHQLGELSLVKQRGGARRWVVPQGWRPTPARTFQPLAHRRLGHPQGVALCAWVQPT